MTTPLLGIAEIANGTVNQYLVANAGARSLESAMTGFLDVSLSAGDATLTSSQFVGYALFRTTGNSVARALVVPAMTRLFYVLNTGSAAVNVVRGTTDLSVSAGQGAAFFTDGGTNNLWLVGGGGGGGGGSTVQNISAACSDESTALTTGLKTTFRMPHGFTLLGVRGSLTSAQASGSLLTVDIKQSGASILSTLMTFDNTEKTTTTSATPAVISTSTLSDDAEITIEITQVGSGTAAGLKVYLVGYSV